MALLAALVAHAGPVALSGAPSALYDDALVGWARYEKRTGTQRGWSTDVLWVKGHAQMPLDL